MKNQWLELRPVGHAEAACRGNDPSSNLEYGNEDYHDVTETPRISSCSVQWK